MQPVAVVWDNREPGGNPGRSRRCVSISIFSPKGSHCENGKTKMRRCEVRRPAFLFGLMRTAMDRRL